MWLAGIFAGYQPNPRVGSGIFLNITGSGRGGSDRVKRFSNSHGSGRITTDWVGSPSPDPTGSDPRSFTRSVNSPGGQHVLCSGPTLQFSDPVLHITIRTPLVSTFSIRDCALRGWTGNRSGEGGEVPAICGPRSEVRKRKGAGEEQG